MRRRALLELLAAVLVAGIALAGLGLAEILLRASRLPSLHLRSLLYESLYEGPATWIVFGLTAAAAMYPIRMIRALARRDDDEVKRAARDREVRLLGTIGGGAAAALLLAAVALVQRARLAADSPDPIMKVIFFARSFAEEVSLWFATGAGLLLLALLWIVATALWARRARGSGVAAVTIVGAATIAGAAGVGLVHFCMEVESFPHEWMEIDARYQGMLATGEPLDRARWILLGAAAIAALALAIAALRDRRPAPRSATIAAAALFAAGLLVFGLTRGFAYDARHPLPIIDGDLAEIPDTSFALLPPGSACAPAMDAAPLIELRDGAWLFDGMATPDLEEVTTRLAKKRELWQLVMPGKTFPGRFDVMAPAATPMTELLPLLQKARAAGFPILAVIERLPAKTFTTRTLGEVAYRPRFCRIQVEPTEEPPRQGTWGDWARALEARPSRP